MRNDSSVAYGLLAPGALYLAIVFLIPIVYMVFTSLQIGGLLSGGFRFTWHFANYVDAFTLYGSIYLRSIVYARIVTLLALLLAYPVAYWIAFYGGQAEVTCSCSCSCCRSSCRS